MSAVSAQPRSARRQARPEGRGRSGARLLRGRPGDPAWARPALLGLLLATAVLYLAGLSRSGYANEFYAAAVQAGTKSWKAFLFGSVDSGNFISVDKTPASLWVMELSGRLFGFNYWSLLVPQALEGVAAVGVLYATVRRWFGAPASATQRVRPDSMARVRAYAASVMTSVSSASGLSKRNIRTATGVRARMAPAMIAAGAPNHRRTVAYSTPTAATPSRACGTSRLQ